MSIRGLCRMKMLPVMILANYHSSARSAVLERPNSSARLVFPMFQVERATCFAMPQLECATRFPNVPSRARDLFRNAPTRVRDSFSQCSKSSARLVSNDRQFGICVRLGCFYYNYYFLSQYAFHVYVFNCIN